MNRVSIKLIFIAGIAAAFLAIAAVAQDASARTVRITRQTSCRFEPRSSSPP